MAPSEVRRAFETLTEPDWALAQAAALLCSSIQLSNIFLRAKRFLPLALGLGALAGALALGRYGANDDPYRALCSMGDCLVLALSVAPSPPVRGKISALRTGGCPAGRARPSSISAGTCRSWDTSIR